MASIFISHSSQDAEVCDEVGRHLQQLGHSPLFVHRHPRESDFVGDQDWAKEVGERAASYEIFITLLSSAWQRSDECRVEAKFASRSGRTILPLKLDPDAPIPGGLLANVIPFSREPTEEHWRALDQALRSVGADPEAFRPQPDRKPFPGLHAFERADAAVYFGRDSDIRAVRELLRRMRRGNRESELPRQCLVVGPSGAGKSSLMRAGVLARLEREPHEWLCPATITPSGDLIAALTDALTTSTGLSRPRIRKALTGGTPDGLMELVKAARERSGQPEAALLLSIDQMEEAFAPELIDETLALLEAHKEMEVALDDPMPMIIMGTLRADSFAGLCNRRDVAVLSLATHRVAPLPIEYLSEVITRPLEVWRRPVRDVRIEPAVVERMIADARRIGGGADAGSGDVLPLVAIALRQLWDDHADTEWFAGLTENHYEETGGLSAIIDEQAKRALREIRKHAGISEAEVYDALIPAVATTDAHGNRVRAWTPPAAFDSRFKPALEILRDARLLQTDSRGSEADNTTETVYSVAHEVVLRQWTGLAHALEQQAETLTLKARIRDEAAAWVRIRRAHEPDLHSSDFERILRARADQAWEDNEAERIPSSYLLLEGDRLGHAKTLGWPEAESAEVCTYIAACEAKQIERAETLAEQERRLEQARQRYLAAQARAATDRGDHLSAMRIALCAWPTDEKVGVHKAVQSALATAADRSAVRRCLTDTSGLIGRSLVAWSPDGHRLVSCRNFGTPKLWDAGTGQRIGELIGIPNISRTGEKYNPRTIAWSPDGRQLVSGNDVGMLMLFDAVTGKLIGKPMTGHNEKVESVAWSPDSRRLASASEDKTLMLWDAETGERIGEPLTGHREEVEDVAWSPDGRRLASASQDGTVMLWDADTGERIGEPMKGHDGWVSSVAWSPDSRRLASASRDGTLMLWDAETGERIGEPMKGHDGWVFSVAWSPDSRRLASASMDERLMLWDAETGKPIGEPMTGHQGWVNAVAWSPHGRRLASASHDGTVMLWETETKDRIGEPLTGHKGSARAVACSPDGRRLASASEDNSLILWEAETGERIGVPLTSHKMSVMGVAWSPDGRRLASASEDNTLMVWDSESGERISEPLTAHKKTVTGVAWSPDGRRLASASEDDTLMLWEAQTGEPIGEPMTGHTPVQSVAWSPDGRRLATGGLGGELVVWDAETGERILDYQISLHDGAVNSVDWSPDGRRLVSASDHTSFWLLDAQTGERIGEPLTGHREAVEDVAWSPDGRRLVSASGDQTLMLWDAETSERIGEPMIGHCGWVYSVDWSPDGRRLVSADEEGKLIRWHISWERLLNGDDLARAVVRRRLWGVEQLTEPELRILRELDGQEPDPDLIIERWGRGSSEDDPFGDPLEECHPGEQDPDSKPNSSE